MAQRRLIYVADDGLEISSSPLTYLDTQYYETWYRIVGAANWNQLISYSPLPKFEIASPATDMPCIVISPLPDDTDFEFKVRRFNSANDPSDWFTGTFTTGTN